MNEEERVATASSWLMPVEPQIEIEESENALEMAGSEEELINGDSSSSEEEENSMQAVQVLESELVDKMCEVCGNVFQTFELVKAEQNKPLLSTCDTCSYYISPPATLTYGSSDSSEVSCNKSPKMCVEKDILRTHSVLKQFFCDLCEKSYKRREKLTEHKRLVHAEEEECVRDKCITCGSIDNIITIDIGENEAESIKLCKACNLSRQEQISKTTKNGTKIFPCDLCSRYFTRKDHATRHRLSHFDDKPFECSICKKSFSRNDRLLRHLKTHPGAEPFSCTVCSRSFADREKLKTHLVTHPKLNERGNSVKCEISQKESRNQNQFPVRKHLTSNGNQKCSVGEVCRKSLNLHGSLLAHQKVHSDRSPFKCDICAMTFKTEKTYTRHLLIHSSDKKFCCKLCPKTFKRKDKLQAHIVVHIDYRPFACEFCNDTFKRKDKYTRHLKVVHNYLSNDESTSEDSESEDLSFEEIIK